MFRTNKKAYFLLFSQYNQIALKSVSFKKRKV